MFHGFDGLMNLSRHQGVDIRPTLLRVLTDLYVQAKNHSLDEERQFAELASRLIDEVDDATRAAVRARLAIYPHTPRVVAIKLNLAGVADGHGPQIPLAPRVTESFQLDPAADFEIVDEPEAHLDSDVAAAQPAPALSPQMPKHPEMDRASPRLSMQPDDAAKLIDMFLAADSAHRARLLHGLSDTPLKPSTSVDPRRAARALATLEQAAMAADSTAFTAELADALILTSRVAAQIVDEPGGEQLACALKALGMPGEVFQRVLLFLNPTRGSSVMDVYRLARLYDVIELRSALIMLAAWRGATLAATRAKYRPVLHDDERHRARATSAIARPAVQPGTATIKRDASQA